MKRNKKSNAEIIVEWLEGRLHDSELTDANIEYFDRIKACYKSILKFDARSKTLKLLGRTFDIDTRTATRIYKDTEFIYGNTRQHNKEFKRLRAEEMALRAYRRADERNDAKGMVQATNAYIRASGVEQEEIDIPNFSELQPGDVITLLPPALQVMMLKGIEQGVVDLNQAEHTIDITPIDEEVTD